FPRGCVELCFGPVVTPGTMPVGFPSFLTVWFNWSVPVAARARPMGVFRALVPAEMSLDEPFPASPYPMPVGDAACVCDGPLARTVLIAKADRDRKSVV